MDSEGFDELIWKCFIFLSHYGRAGCAFWFENAVTRNDSGFL